MTKLIRKPTELIRKMWSDDEGQQLVTPETLATLPSAPEQLPTLDHIDDERVITELRACWLSNLAADVEAERRRSVRIKYLAAITLAGLICAGTVWALRGRSSHIDSAKTSTASESSQATVSPSAATAPRVLPPRPPAPAVSLPVVDAQPSAVLSEVLPEITYEYGQNFARFFMDVPGHLRLHAIALRNPDRIYFDVPESAARVRHKSVDMNNEFVRRIRVSPKGGGVTRVVLDLKCSCTYRFQPLSSPRHGVEIEIRPPSAETARLHTKPLP
jgi:hypothetical protein